jgi:hypothetical protein
MSPTTHCARPAAPLISFCLADRESISGRLMAIQGDMHGGSDRPLTYVFRTFDGRERRFQEAEVARAYLGSYDPRLPATARNAKTNVKVPPGSGSGTESSVVALR